MKIINLGNRDDASFYTACELFNQISRHPDSKLGMATGGTMVDVYSNFVNLLERNQLDVSNVETFNLDEYIGLSADHPENYHHYMHEVLFDRYPHFKEENVHLPIGDAKDLEAETSRYEQLIKEQGPVDIQILGIGENGHIGFNEPADHFPKETHCVDLAEPTIEANARFFESREQVPTQAYTMGIQNIMAAKQILMVANGKGKAKILKEAFQGPITPQIPASILQLHPNVILVADE